MAVIMDPAGRRIWLAPGSPCAAPFELLDYAGFLGIGSMARSEAEPLETR
jgi:hypothetical protein